MTRRTGWQDQLISAADLALRTLTAPSAGARSSPAENLSEADLTPDERRTSIALMRVNHAGEITAQALYSGQSVFARAEETRHHLEQAAEEEQDHLAWCSRRLTELGGRASLLDPIWYGGGFLLGLLAGSAGDRISLGFIAETERQVEAHLQDHLQRLPQADRRSTAILEAMAHDEAHHGTTARLAGGVDLPAAVRSAMAVGGELLRRIALRV
jgi:ubiquinone biosynthesis monooxygenase Coq7